MWLSSNSYDARIVADALWAKRNILLHDAERVLDPTIAEQNRSEAKRLDELRARITTADNA